MAKLSWLVLVSIVTLAFSDVYMHGARGSNDRLNEQAATRNNADRLFDSQNNNRGGYNVGDRTKDAFDGNNPVRANVDGTGGIYDFNDRANAAQYPMVYYERSILPIEWTNQHGCGGDAGTDPNKLTCQVVIQYACDTPRDGNQKSTAYNGDYALGVYLYDGGNTNTPDEPGNIGAVSSGSTFASNNNNQRGRHESEGWYFECKTRSRNKGLFTADQNLNGNTAIYTRQNPNGGRRGLECPEERDYYPYWTPTPWRDIAYLTDRLDMTTYIQAESMNSNTKYKCKEATGNNPPYTSTAVIAAITPTACAAAGGVWVGYTHNLPAATNTVKVQQMPWTRDNHLGNGREGQHVGFNWTMPDFDELVASGRVRTYGSQNTYIKCVVRLRYNISTDDYDPWNTTSKSNNNAAAGVRSPVTQNPTVDVGSADLQGLALAINTNQFGRTFQDRSHIFYLKKRPAAIDANKIWNLNVRGKRGNIVQTYPAIEYDFLPNILTINSAAHDLIHFQWTGSNTHNNGAPAGDGQAGDAGEGTGGTDRHNWCQADQTDDNYPIPLDKWQPESMLLGGHSTCYDINFVNLDTRSTTETPGINCALTLATSGYFLSTNEITNTINPTLDTAPASLVGGVLVDVRQAGTYNYLNTRNNNFSNRGQKGAINVL